MYTCSLHANVRCNLRPPLYNVDVSNFCGGFSDDSALQYSDHHALNVSHGFKSRMVHPGLQSKVSDVKQIICDVVSARLVEDENWD